MQIEINDGFFSSNARNGTSYQIFANQEWFSYLDKYMYLEEMVKTHLRV